MQSKVFVGTRVTPELSELIGDTQEFQLVPYEGKRYVGLYLDTKCPTLTQVREVCDHFVATLQVHCPQLRCDRLPIIIFPQLFLG